MQRDELIKAGARKGGARPEVLREAAAHVYEEGCRGWAQTIREAADEIERLSAVPAGWKLVPEEATEEMMDAAVDKARKCLPADDGKFGYVQARAAFSAFLTAAPPPPSDTQ